MTNQARTADGAPSVARAATMRATITPGFPSQRNRVSSRQTPIQSMTARTPATTNAPTTIGGGP